MKGKITTSVLILSLPLFLLVFNKPVFGQGTADCVWNDSAKTCTVQSNCDSGYIPPPPLVSLCASKTSLISCKAVSVKNCVTQAAYNTATSGNNYVTACSSMGTTGIETALGCIPTGNTNIFVAWVLKFTIGIGGGIAFLLMLVGVFQIITSAGSPDKLKGGKETITSAIIGLLMIVFSLFLLRLIGIDILQIPGL